jgi:D-tyrosyl-tRNA(Tyr) deacylase
MRAVVQRCDSAEVVVEGQVTGSFEGEGLLALVGATHTDTPADAKWLAGKIANLRILHGERSALEAGAPVIIVSQFTLYGDARKGRRPTWQAAAPGEIAQPLIDDVCLELRMLGLKVSTGVFGAHMRVTSTNDGPFTVLLER